MGKDKSTSKVSKTSKSGHKRKQDDKTLTSASGLRCLCPCGKGGFGAVYVVSIDGVSHPCVLKKLLKVGDKAVIKECRKEFKIQLKLFIECFNRIPRPIYILDLLDEDYRGVYGFCMEFCIGGSVKDFSRSWCVGGKYGRGCSSSSVESEDSSSDSDFEPVTSSTRIDPMTLDPLRVSALCVGMIECKYGRGCSSSSVESEDSSSDSDFEPVTSSTRIDPMTLDPLRVSALCVGMIECLSEVFKAKPDLIHRDIKPGNFLVRVEPKTIDCAIVLSDLGLAQIQDYISSSTTSKSFVDISMSEDTEASDQSEFDICGTLVYNSCEALKGDHSQESDGYSLGLTILAMFKAQDPFLQMKVLHGIESEILFAKKLKEVIESDMGPKLCESRLFRTLKTIEGGKFKPVYSCLNEIFEGLTKLDIDKRMSVHEACEKVQSIKPLLPKIGEGWECPSIDDIVKAQLAKYKGDSGCILEGDASIQNVELKPNWDDGLSQEEEEEDLRKEVDRKAKEVEALKQKLKLEEEKRKREELKIYAVKTKELELKSLILSIKRKESQSAITSLYKESYPRLKAIFDEFTSSPSAITSNIDLFELCFECLSLFVKHKEVEALKQKLKLEEEKRKREELKIYAVKTKELELKSLILSIKRKESQSAITSLYKESYPRLKAIFDEFTSSPSAITSNIDLFELCFECLSLFVKHKVTKRDGTLKEDKDDIEVILDSSSIKNINDTFLPSMIRVENILRVKEEEEEEEEEDGRTGEAGVNSITMLLFRIIGVSTVHVEYLFFSIFPQISPLLSKMFILGLSKKFEDSFIEDILKTCRNIAFAKDDPTKNSLLSLLLPHILPWMKKYPDKKFFFLWTNILKNITNDKDNIKAHKDRSSQLWFVFHPVLDVIKDTASKGITFDDAVIRCFRFFANFSCIPSQAVEVHDCIKDGLLDGWFEMIKKKSEAGKDDGNWGIKYWSKLISMFSTVPSLVPHISPKYDADMEWCKNNGTYNGGLYDDYSRYLGNCYPSLKKWSDLVESIKKCPDSASTSKLYHEHRDEILSVFLAFQSKSEIEENKREIVLCAQCLNWFVGHVISGNYIYLPIPDLNDLIDTFIDHLSRCKEVLEGDVDGEYCMICLIYTFKVHDKLDSFLPKISPTFQRILERGSKEKLGGGVALRLLIPLKNISISPSSSTKSSILTLIKPYIRDWLRIYNDSECYGEWMVILSLITLSSDNKSPNKSLCSEVWPLFHPVLDVVKREFVGDKIVEDDHERVLRFFSHLCCDPSHTVEVYDNVKDLLDGWFAVIKKKEHKQGITCWSALISMFSTVPSLVPRISPIYDTNMEWCKNNGGWNEDYTRYSRNCKM
ncbi:hypothetical protein ADUPG1_006190 [Aduncisulcus paluster]|uniref:Protein kinase domain-containing protein n=1 Tax=Aduncisulcus paluster TaxID=2918883 RepID=A0ABQ5KH53_9EUKA|nr:hypothetical protein ADUPG1_006190 [Aduncisulcus paluster]